MAVMFDSYDHALATAAQGLGVAMGMQPYLHREFSAGTLVEAFTDLRIPHEDDWYFVCRRSREETPKITLFNQWLLELVQQDPDNFPRREQLHTATDSAHH